MVLHQTPDGWFEPLEATSEEEQRQVDEHLRSRLVENPELLKFLQLKPSAEQQTEDGGDNFP